MLIKWLYTLFENNVIEFPPEKQWQQWAINLISFITLKQTIMKMLKHCVSETPVSSTTGCFIELHWVQRREEMSEGFTIIITLTKHAVSVKWMTTGTTFGCLKQLLPDTPNQLDGLEPKSLLSFDWQLNDKGTKEMGHLMVDI